MAAAGCATYRWIAVDAPPSPYYMLAAGRGAQGRLGQADEKDHVAPAAVMAPATSYAAVAAGRNHTVAVDGELLRAAMLRVVLGGLKSKQ